MKILRLEISQYSQIYEYRGRWTVVSELEMRGVIVRNHFKKKCNVIKRSQRLSSWNIPNYCFHIKRFPSFHVSSINLLNESILHDKITQHLQLALYCNTRIIVSVNLFCIRLQWFMFRKHKWHYINIIHTRKPARNWFHDVWNFVLTQV